MVGWGSEVNVLVLATGKQKVADTKSVTETESYFKHCLCLLLMKVMTVLDKVTAKGWGLESRLFIKVHYCFGFDFPGGNHWTNIGTTFPTLIDVAKLPGFPLYLKSLYFCILR